MKAASSRALERALLQTGEGVVGWGDLEDAVGEVRFVDVRCACLILLSVCMF